MTTNTMRWRRTLGVYIFFSGILLGMMFAALLAWADFEASLFNAIPDASAQRLESLRCPILLNRHETGTISASFANPSDLTRRRTIDAYISHGSILLMLEERTRFDLEPGEKRTVEWPISSENAAWGRFVLARLYVQRNTPLPSRTGSCGVLVVDLPFGSGVAIAMGIIGASVLLMAIGAMLWLNKSGKPLRTVDYLNLALAPVTLLALVFSITGVWLASGLLLVLSFLLIVSIITWVLG